MAMIDLKNCTVRLLDGTGTPKKLTLKIGDGNITYDEHRAIQYVKDRGKLDTARLADEEPVDVTLDLQWSFLTQDTDADPAEPITPEDALKARGGASDWVTSSGDPCEPYAVDIEIDNIPPCGGVTPEKILLQDFRYETLAHDPKAGTLRATGKCNVLEATVTRAAVTS